MRPVHRGDAPNTYARYQDAIGDLESRLGIYCSYCERRLPASLAVEHVNPKSVTPALETEWSNFLLSCTNCNSVKGQQVTNGEDYLWPDRDNTFLAFEYREGGFVAVSAGLNADVEPKAAALRDLVGLDRHRLAGPGRRPAPRDKRWKDREQVWQTAATQKERLGRFPPAVHHLVRQYIVEAAEGFGFFSVWVTVFADDTEIRRQLIARFPGTAADCFDFNGKAVARPGGRL